MKHIHVKISDELHHLLKVMTAHRGETVTDAITRLTWWYVDGTDNLMLVTCEEVLHGVMPTETARCAFERAQMRFNRAADAPPPER